MIRDVCRRDDDFAKSPQWQKWRMRAAAVKMDAAARRRGFQRALFRFLAALVIGGLLPAQLCWSEAPKKHISTDSDPEKIFGIRIISLRPTALGRMLDLRFEVVDPEKAEPILDKKNKAFIVDAKSGKTLPVPVTKSGSMRQTTLKPEAGRVYFILFTNPSGMVKEDSSVALVIGDFRKEGIKVDSSGATSSPKGPKEKSAIHESGEPKKP